MTISGESHMSTEKEEGGYAVRERQFGKFSRTLQLPPEIKVRSLLSFLFTSLTVIYV